MTLCMLKYGGKEWRRYKEMIDDTKDKDEDPEKKKKERERQSSHMLNTYI